MPSSAPARRSLSPAPSVTSVSSVSRRPTSWRSREHCGSSSRRSATLPPRTMTSVCACSASATTPNAGRRSRRLSTWREPQVGSQPTLCRSRSSASSSWPACASTAHRTRPSDHPSRSPDRSGGPGRILHKPSVPTHQRGDPAARRHVQRGRSARCCVGPERSSALDGLGKPRQPDPSGPSAT